MDQFFPGTQPCTCLLASCIDGMDFEELAPNVVQ